MTQSLLKEEDKAASEQALGDRGKEKTPFE